MASLVAIARAVRQFFQELVSIPINQSLDSALEHAVVAEHELRLLFEADIRIEDRYLGLANIFSLHPAARRTRPRHPREGSNDASDHHILPLSSRCRRTDLASSTVFNIEAFQKQWELFTHGVLSKMRPQDWENVVVAGGSVLACLMPPPATSERHINEHFQSTIWGSSDVDIFLWGMSAEQAEVKLRNIYEAVSAAAHWKVVCVRRAQTVSIHTTYPYRPIQIILRLYQSPAEILAGFDVDAACCLYNGKEVWVNPRAAAALVRQANTVDVTKHSPSYELRLVKYAERSFEIYVPTLDRERIRASLYDRALRSLPNGLARLLVFEEMYFHPSSYIYLPNQNASNSSLSKSRFDDDLKWVRIPYGPGWDASKIQNLITRKAWRNALSWLSATDLDLYNVAPHNPLNRGGVVHRHIFFVGNMMQCLRPVCEECNAAGVTEQNEMGPEGSNLYVRGRIRFMTTNPGHQAMTGSFHPMNLEDWEREAYEEASPESSTSTVFVVDPDAEDSNGQWLH